MSPLPKPELETNRTISLLTSIWIVPLVALAVSGWLVYQHFATLGSEIRIHFPTSGSLIAGESVIKFRDVTVGKVVKIQLQKGGDGITVTARMQKEVTPWLNDSARFWIVSPQVDYQGVRGLETLLHGAYIALDAPRKGAIRTEFEGLDHPFKRDGEGIYVHLRTDRLGNVHAGGALYYHNLRAGSIEEISLGRDGRTTEITVFVSNKFTHLINTTTKIWHQDLVALSIDKGQIAFDLAPLTSVLLGSISFESDPDVDAPPPPQDHVFKLYSSYAAASRQRIGAPTPRWHRFAFVYSGEISGLKPGTPIHYQGFRVGEIDAAPIRYDRQRHAMSATAIGRIDVSVFADANHTGLTNLHEAVCHGLHAELKSNNPVIENLYINLVYTDEPPRQCIWSMDQNLTRFPTKERVENAVLSQLEHLIDSLSALASENRQPLRDLIASFKQSADHLNTLMAKPSFQSLTDELNTTMGSLGDLMGKSGKLDQALDELQKTLKTTKRVLRGYGSGSLFGRKLEAMIKEVGRTSEETKRLIEKLNKKPNALIFGE